MKKKEKKIKQASDNFVNTDKITAKILEEWANDTEWTPRKKKEKK